MSTVTRRAPRLDYLPLDYYHATSQPRIESFGPLSFLVLDGRGDPAGEHFQSAIAAIYGVAYTLKFALKAAGKDFKVAALEALWWTGEEGAAPGAVPVDPAAWTWRLLLPVPPFVTAEDLQSARSAAIARRGPACADVRLEVIDEGEAVQVLHLGPYGDEPKTVASMLEFAAAQGRSLLPPHHEIYLSDPHRVAPDRLRTILRHPVKSVSSQNLLASHPHDAQA